MDGQDLTIDDKAIKRLERWILIQESVNLRTKEFTDQQMITKIKKKIEEEVQCCLNQ